MKPGPRTPAPYQRPLQPRRAAHRLWPAFCVGLVAALSSISPATPAHGTELKGYIEESIARQLGGDEDIFYHRQTISMKASGDMSKRVKLRVEVDVWRDDADFQEGGEYHSRIREAYARIRFKDFDIRVGRLQLAWGEADGTIVSDQVSPFDFTNFIVPTFDAIRLGVDGATFDYYFANGDDLQLIWLAQFTSPDFPEQASPWSFFDSPVPVARPDKPTATMSHSEFGVRYSGHPIWADWSVGYLHSVDDRPAPRVQGPLLQPTHDHFELFTANIAAPVGDYLIRFDTAYELGRFLSTDFMDPAAFDTAADGFVVRQDVSRTLLAVDMKPDIEWWHQADASFQYVHEQVIDPHGALNQAREDDFLSVLLQAAYLNDTIKPWLFTMVNVRGADWWVQAKIDYEPWDNWRFSLEYDRFSGHAFDRATNSGGLFGGFADNDMMMGTVRRSF